MHMIGYQYIYCPQIGIHLLMNIELIYGIRIYPILGIHPETRETMTAPVSSPLNIEIHP